MAAGGTGDSSSIAQALSTLAGALIRNSSQSPQSSPSVQNVALHQANVSLPGGLGNSGNSIATNTTGNVAQGVLRPQHILPSFMRRSVKKTKSNVAKKPKVIQSWDRDIICLPQSRCNRSTTSMCFSYPRGQYRLQLGQMGLIGKVHLTSEMDEDDVKEVIRSVFKDAMNHDSNFPFVFLQSAGEGSKSLVIPSQSSNYRWTGQQVARLAGQKGTIYILAQADIPLKDTEESESEDDTKTGQVNNEMSLAAASQTFVNTSSVAVSLQSQVPPSPSASNVGIYAQEPRRERSVDSYSKYVGLIDLTKDDSESDSDISDLPDFSLSKNERNSPIVADPVKLKHVLPQHQKRVLCDPDDEAYQRINIRRSCLLADSFRQFAKHSFNVQKFLRVVFLGESAVDDGGPRREFFHHLMRDLFDKSGLFYGYPEHVVPAHDVQALADNKYFLAGKMIATSIVQGGEAPSCFSKAVADFIVFGEVHSPVCVEDIPDHSVQDCLKQVSSANTEDELQQVFHCNDFDFLFTCGYSKPTCQVHLKDKDKLVKAVWLHYVSFFPRAELEQLKRGIRSTLEMDILIAMHHDSMWSLLVASTTFDVTAEYLSDAFIIMYSDNGSNNRTKEEAVVFSWFEYISECQGRKDVTLSHILQFLTGSSRLPAAGFSKDPVIRFADADNRLPNVSTCDISITFPRSMGHLSVEAFRELLDFCILGSVGFGTP